MSPGELDASVPTNCPDIEFIHITCWKWTSRDKGILTLNTVLIRPKSAPTMRLQTSNSPARPEIEPWFFSAPEDIIPLRKGVCLAGRLADDVVKQRYPQKNLLVPEGLTSEHQDVVPLTTCPPGA